LNEIVDLKKKNSSFSRVYFEYFSHIFTETNHNINEVAEIEKGELRTDGFSKKVFYF